MKTIIILICIFQVAQAVCKDGFSKDKSDETDRKFLEENIEGRWLFETDIQTMGDSCLRIERISSNSYGVSACNRPFTLVSSILKFSAPVGLGKAPRLTREVLTEVSPNFGLDHRAGKLIRTERGGNIYHEVLLRIEITPGYPDRVFLRSMYCLEVSDRGRVGRNRSESWKSKQQVFFGYRLLNL